VATAQAIENVNSLLYANKLIPHTVPYDQLVATDFMPKEFAEPKTH